MAKYVVLEFDNDIEADNFVDIFQRAHVPPDEDAAVMRVRAVFKKPTIFCTCPPSDKSVRGTKYGWWVHKDCGRPKKGSWQHPRNLLDPADQHPKERTIYLGVAEGGPPYARDTPKV